MLNITWKLRVSAEELEAWKVAAGSDGEILSVWIRNQCNEAASAVDKPSPEVLEKVIGKGEWGDPVRRVTERVAEKEQPNPMACANCDHLKSKHGGFKGACQADTCLCGGFE